MWQHTYWVKQKAIGKENLYRNTKENFLLIADTIICVHCPLNWWLRFISIHYISAHCDPRAIWPSNHWKPLVQMNWFESIQFMTQNRYPIFHRRAMGNYHYIYEVGATAMLNFAPQRLVMQYIARMLLTNNQVWYVNYATSLRQKIYNIGSVCGYIDTEVERHCAELYWWAYVMWIFTSPLWAKAITFEDLTVIFFTGGRPMTWESAGRCSVPWWPRLPASLHPAVHMVPSENSVVF